MLIGCGLAPALTGACNPMLAIRCLRSEPQWMQALCSALAAAGRCEGDEVLVKCPFSCGESCLLIADSSLTTRDLLPTIATIPIPTSCGVSPHQRAV